MNHPLQALGRIWGRYRRWYDATFLPWYNRWAPAMVVGCLVTVALVTIGTYVNYASLESDRREREMENSALLGCFDEYASASATTSKAVRDASVSVDEARVNRDRALQRLFEVIAAEPPEGDPRGQRAFARLLVANRALVGTQKQLDQVRKENPVPDPPSDFCELP